MAVVTAYRWEEVWPSMRDCAKGTTPLAQQQLDALRTYTEPSKAHIKRLLKVRPKVTIAPKRIAPDPSARLRTNELIHYRDIARRAITNDRIRRG